MSDDKFNSKLYGQAWGRKTGFGSRERELRRRIDNYTGRMHDSLNDRCRQKSGRDNCHCFYFSKFNRNREIRTDTKAGKSKRFLRSTLCNYEVIVEIHGNCMPGRGRAWGAK